MKLSINLWSEKIMLIKQLKNLKPQLNIPSFHHGFTIHGEQNKRKLSYIQSFIEIRMIPNSDRDSINLSLVKYLSHCIYSKFIDHMRKHSKLFNQMDFALSYVFSFKVVVPEINPWQVTLWYNSVWRLIFAKKRKKETNFQVEMFLHKNR